MVSHEHLLSHAILEEAVEVGVDTRVGTGTGEETGGRGYKICYEKKKNFVQDLVKKVRHNVKRYLVESFAEHVGGEYSKLGLENDGEYRGDSRERVCPGRSPASKLPQSLTQADKARNASSEKECQDTSVSVYLGLCNHLEEKRKAEGQTEAGLLSPLKTSSGIECILNKSVDDTKLSGMVDTFEG
ncbi:hypothetical protein TURU_088963 [Turdus rufiventris]|nr:hypothetical protein TURU_088963 [Turdus rufiventris]